MTPGVSIEDFPFKEEAALFRSLESKREEKRRRIYNMLRHPFRTYVTNYSFGLIAGAACAGLFAMLLVTGGVGVDFFPKEFI